jgi:hypothetical protein
MAFTYISFFRNWVLHRFDRRISPNVGECYNVLHCELECERDRDLKHELDRDFEGDRDRDLLFLLLTKPGWMSVRSPSLVPRGDG